MLDFVGHQRKEFRFDIRVPRLTGCHPTVGFAREIEQGFPFLPSGCQIVLDGQAQELVLREHPRPGHQPMAQMVAELRAAPANDLAAFLEIRRRAGRRRPQDRSWTRLRRDAGLPTRAAGARTRPLLKRVRSLAHVDDPDRAAAYLELLADDAPAYAALDPPSQAFARMLLLLALARRWRLRVLRRRLGRACVGARRRELTSRGRRPRRARRPHVTADLAGACRRPPAGPRPLPP